MLRDPVGQKFGEDTGRMTCFFPEYLGHIWKNMEIRGHLMAGHWHHLKVCLLTCLVSRLGWLKYESCWPEHLPVASLYGLAPLEHRGLRVGHLTWWFRSLRTGILSDEAECIAFYDNLKRHIAALWPYLLVKVVRSPLDSKEEKRDLHLVAGWQGHIVEGEVG